MTFPTTRADLLARMHQAHGVFSALLDRIPEEYMTETALYDNWSVKDLVGHMLGWYELTLERVAAARRGDTPRKFENYNYDPFNAELTERYREIPLDKIRRLEADRFAQLTRIVEEGNEAELFDVERYPQAGRSIASYMMSSTVQHYADHLDDVRAWMRQNGLE